MDIEVVNYIKQARQHGLHDNEIKQNLLNTGWEAEIVEASFTYVKALDSKEAETTIVHPSTQPAKTPTTQPVASPAAVTATPDAESATNQTPVVVIKKHSRVVPAIFAAVVIILILAGGAYAYVNFIANNPTATWTKFWMLPKPQVYSNQFSLTYKDSIGSLATGTGSSLLPFNSFTFGMNGNYSLNAADIKNPSSYGNFTFNFMGDSGISFNSPIEYTIVNNALYLHISKSPLLAKYAAEYFPSKTVDWLKIDLSQGDQQFSVSGTSTQSAQNLKLLNDLKPIWTKNQIITITKNLGSEKVSGVDTFHYSNALDTKALTTAVNQSIDVIAKDSTQADLTATTTAEAKLAAATLIGKLSLSNFEMWLGKSDSELYRIKFDAKFPSFISLAASTGIGQAQSESRDAKRLADMRQMGSALELYYNDNGGYPASTSDGKPVSSLAPTYIDVLPTTPEPADGTCTEYYNTYWYSTSGTPFASNGQTVYPSYTFTSCLGSDFDGYLPGIVQISPTGISNISCSGTKSQCTSGAPELTEEGRLQKQLEALTATAEITFDSTYSNYNKINAITAPANAISLTDLIGNPFGGTSSSTDNTGLMQ